MDATRHDGRAKLTCGAATSTCHTHSSAHIPDRRFRAQIVANDPFTHKPRRGEDKGNLLPPKRSSDTEYEVVGTVVNGQVIVNVDRQRRNARRDEVPDCGLRRLGFIVERMLPEHERLSIVHWTQMVADDENPKRDAARTDLSVHLSIVPLSPSFRSVSHHSRSTFRERMQQQSRIHQQIEVCTGPVDWRFLNARFGSCSSCPPQRSRSRAVPRPNRRDAVSAVCRREARTFGRLKRTNRWRSRSPPKATLTHSALPKRLSRPSRRISFQGVSVSCHESPSTSSNSMLREMRLSKASASLPSTSAAVGVMDSGKWIVFSRAEHTRAIPATRPSTAGAI